MEPRSKSGRTLKRAGVFFLGTVTLSIATAWAILHAVEGNTIQTFTGMFLAWKGYLIAHYAETGRFIDPKLEDVVLPEESSEIGMAGVGAATVLAGVGIEAIAIASTDFLMASVGISVAISGYLIAHHAMTDLLL